MNKQQLRDWIDEGMTRVAVFMYQTYGIPLDAFNDELSGRTRGEQMAFLSSFAKDYPSVFEGMPRYVP